MWTNKSYKHNPKNEMNRELGEHPYFGEMVFSSFFLFVLPSKSLHELVGRKIAVGAGWGVNLSSAANP